MTNLIIAIAIVIMALAITLLSVRVKVTEEAVDSFDFDKYSERMDEIDRDLDKCELNVNEFNESIEETISLLEQITADIKRLDEQATRDHANLVDIRERYILWRDPVDTGSGVNWASQYKCNEETENG